MNKDSFYITIDKIARKTKGSREYKILEKRLNKIFKEEWRFREIRIPEKVKSKIAEIKETSLEDVLKKIKSL